MRACWFRMTGWEGFSRQSHNMSSRTALHVCEFMPSPQHNAVVEFVADILRGELPTPSVRVRAFTYMFDTFKPPAVSMKFFLQSEHNLEMETECWPVFRVTGEVRGGWTFLISEKTPLARIPDAVRESLG